MSPAAQNPIQGTCVGYEIRSSLPFRTLRAGGGVPLTIDERNDLAPAGDVVATWQPRRDNPFHGRLLKEGDRYAFWASDAGWYVIDPPKSSIFVAEGGDPLRRELRLFGIPAAVCAFEDGDISLHASAVDIFGQGLLLAGPSMYGKTTLAAAFASAGHRLLSEDTTRCSLSPVASIYPGPAVLRLRADVARSLHVPGARTAGTMPEEGRTPLIFDPHVRGSGDPVPLRAVLILRAHAEAAVLERMPAAEAARHLFALAFRLPTDASRAACFARVVDLTARVETLNLRRPMTIESLSRVVSLVERHIGHSA
jgi:hypothetical protein